jgi:hypothetical protein
MYPSREILSLNVVYTQFSQRRNPRIRTINDKYNDLHRLNLKKTSDLTKTLQNVVGDSVDGTNIRFFNLYFVLQEPGPWRRTRGRTPAHLARKGNHRASEPTCFFF